MIPVEMGNQHHINIFDHLCGREGKINRRVFLNPGKGVYPVPRQKYRVRQEGDTGHGNF
jgi:hypothetical protein